MTIKERIVNRLRKDEVSYKDLIFFDIICLWIITASVWTWISPQTVYPAVNYIFIGVLSVLLFIKSFTKWGRRMENPIFPKN